MSAVLVWCYGGNFTLAGIELIMTVSHQTALFSLILLQIWKTLDTMRNSYATSFPLVHYTEHKILALNVRSPSLCSPLHASRSNTPNRLHLPIPPFSPMPLLLLITSHLPTGAPVNLHTNCSQQVAHYSTLDSFSFSSMPVQTHSIQVVHVDLLSRPMRSSSSSSLLSAGALKGNIALVKDVLRVLSMRVDLQIPGLCERVCFRRKYENGIWVFECEVWRMEDGRWSCTIVGITFFHNDN
jgi:hypothetical protein